MRRARRLWVVRNATSAGDCAAITLPLPPATTSVSKRSSPHGCVAISTPAELATIPPCGEIATQR